MRMGTARPAASSWEQKTGCQNIRKYFPAKVLGPVRMKSRCFETLVIDLFLNVMNFKGRVSNLWLEDRSPFFAPAKNRRCGSAAEFLLSRGASTRYRRPSSAFPH